MLTQEQKTMIDLVIEECDENDDSTEKMLAMCADRAKCEVDDVVEYLGEDE